MFFNKVKHPQGHPEISKYFCLVYKNTQNKHHTAKFNLTYSKVTKYLFHSPFLDTVYHVENDCSTW